MRQFLLGKNVAYATGSDLLKVVDGAVGVFYNKNGVLTATSTGAEITKEAMLVLGRKAENGGPVVLPLYKNNFSYSKMVYAAAKKFKAAFTIPAANKVGDYTLIIVLKGQKFNERNKWTAMVHNTDTTTTAAVMADKLMKAINANNGQNVTASVSGAELTIEGNVAGVDFEVIGADELMGMTTVDIKTGVVTNGVTLTNRGEAGWGSAAYVTDLANKAAADAGFEYTYRDAYVDLYPQYPLNPLAQPNSTDAGYTIFTLRFAEPRATATTDEVVNQIVQVAFPTGSAAISTFETVCKAIASINSSTTNDSDNGDSGSDSDEDPGETEEVFIGTSVNDTSMGSVSGMGTYTKGETVTLTATPNSSYRFVKWTDEVTDNPRTIIAEANGVVYTAIFEAE